MNRGEQFVLKRITEEFNISLENGELHTKYFEESLAYLCRQMSVTAQHFKAHHQPALMFPFLIFLCFLWAFLLGSPPFEILGQVVFQVFAVLKLIWEGTCQTLKLICSILRPRATCPFSDAGCMQGLHSLSGLGTIWVGCRNRKIWDTLENFSKLAEEDSRTKPGQI